MLVSFSDPVACILELPAEEATTLIKNVRLEDQDRGNFRPYLENGNGNVGFTLHNVQKVAEGGYRYVQVRLGNESMTVCRRWLELYFLVPRDGKPQITPKSSVK